MVSFRKDTSFPFLKIAREAGVPYGHVMAYLCAVEALSPLEPPFTERELARLPYWQTAAVAVLGGKTQIAILNALSAEGARRAAVTA